MVNSRLPGLDILRAVAILLVLYSHLILYVYQDLYSISFENLLFVDGVDLFFVLSGFLIGGILLSFYESKNQITFKTTLHNFWKRRWFRTLPLYYAVFFVYLLINFPQGKSLLSFLPAFFFLQNIFNYISIPFGVSWSLAIEEWFYLLLPISFILVTKFFPHNLNVRKRFFIVIILFLLVPFLIRLFYSPMLGIESRGDFWRMIRMVVIFRFDTLAFGLFGAYLYRYHLDLWTKWKNYSFLIGICILLLVHYSINHYLNFSGIYYRVFYLDILALGIFLLLPKLSLLTNKTTYFIPFFSFISLISYSLYLIHMLVVAFIRQHTYLFSGYVSATFFYIIATFSISTLVYFFYERPFMNLRDKI